MRAFDVRLVVCFLVEAFRVLPAGGAGGGGGWGGGASFYVFPLVFSFTALVLGSEPFLVNVDSGDLFEIKIRKRKI